MMVVEVEVDVEVEVVGLVLEVDVEVVTEVLVLDDEVLVVDEVDVELVEVGTQRPKMSHTPEQQSLSSPQGCPLARQGTVFDVLVDELVVVVDEVEVVSVVLVVVCAPTGRAIRIKMRNKPMR